MVTVLETNNQTEHSPGYTGNIHDVLSRVDFLYRMPLGNALQILFVSLSLRSVAIGIQIQWTQFLIMEPFFIFN